MMLMKFKIAKIVGVAVWLMLISLGPSSAAERQLRVAYPAPAGAFLPLWAAQDAGIFKKHGLQVELIAVGSSTRGIAAIVSGDLDILAGGGSSGVTSQLQGYSDMALFANVIQSFLFSVMVQPSITEVAQLRGKRMGVTRFGGTLDFVARQYVKRQGMEPGKDVTFVQIGAMPDIVVSVLTGAIESGVIGIPQNFSPRSRACANWRICPRAVRDTLSRPLSPSAVSWRKITSAWCASSKRRSRRFTISRPGPKKAWKS